MIIEGILTVFSFLLEFLLGLLPNLPSLPASITDGIDTLFDSVTGVIGLISYLYTPVLTIFVFTAVLVLLNFDNVYKLVLWFYHKVRG